MLKTALLVGCGGFCGALGRWLVYKLVQFIAPHHFIGAATLAVNITGSFALSWVMYSLSGRLNLPSHSVTFLATGFMGAFTTFSTFSYEAMLWLKISPLKGIIYSGLMMFGCLAAAWAGMYTAGGK